MSTKWNMSESEVSCNKTSSASGKTGQFNRQLQARSCTVTLVHKPTGLQVEETIPRGNYSKNEMQKLQMEAYKGLFRLLEAKVGKHLRVQGRN